MKEKFSVLMSVYHKDDPTYLDTALNSLTEQTAVPDEIVLVKDGPVSQQLEDVIDAFHKKFRNLKIVALEKNSGLGNALNQGLKHCSHELVARMDSDDISEPHRFEKQLAAFESDGKISICGGWISEFEGSPDNILLYRRVATRHEDIVKMARSMSPMNHVTVMFKKSHVMEVGSYLPFFQFEDYYLWIRLIKAGRLFSNIPSVLVNVRGGREMASRRGGLKYIKAEMRFQKILLNSGIISSKDFVKNCVIRSVVRLLPNAARSWVYGRIRKYQSSQEL